MDSRFSVEGNSRELGEEGQALKDSQGFDRFGVASTHTKQRCLSVLGSTLADPGLCVGPSVSSSCSKGRVKHRLEVAKELRFVHGDILV